LAGALPEAALINDDQSFRGLDVWQEAMMLVEEIYIQSRRFPSDERFGLTSPLRRAAVSVPSNIGEGAGMRFGLAIASAPTTNGFENASPESGGC